MGAEAMIDLNVIEANARDYENAGFTATAAKLRAIVATIRNMRAAISTFLLAEHDHSVRQTHESLMAVAKARAALGEF